MQHNLNIDFSQTEPVTCEECHSTYFEQAIVLRKASGMLMGTGQPAYIPIPVFSCKECGHVNGEFLPQEGPKFSED